MKIRDSVIIVVIATIVYIIGTLAFAASTKKLDIKQACDQFCANFDMKVVSCDLVNSFANGSRAEVWCERRVDKRQ